MIMLLSAQHGEKPEDTWVNHCISAKLDAFHAPAKSGPTTWRSLEAKIKSFLFWPLRAPCFPLLRPALPEIHASTDHCSAGQQASKNELSQPELRAWGPMEVN